ncbi:4'-phosphopantetheinyl transferase superfamily protein [Rhodoferax sp.]|uniref:4'-phosphopantetheinyl transferase superfamily protein n=1 Tax=Rhodoferax sp. TaxID=50421 RepID=UPI0025D21637|nr:4'-phosphopantetheinyl transferase superfamily protein [Rhodoferax sp.]
MQPVRVHNQFSDEAAQDLREQELVLFTLALRPGLPRAEARQLARATLQHALQRHLGREAHAISIETVPGNAPVVMVGGRRVHVSLSYESDRAFIAIDMHGPIGIDAAAVGHQAEWFEECVGVANEYLPPSISQKIKALAGLERATAFAAAWALHEARLKCLGLPLQEWTNELDTQLAATRGGSICDHEGFMAAYARKDRKNSQMAG